jgi:pilus assembly protein CpaF
VRRQRGAEEVRAGLSADHEVPRRVMTEVSVNGPDDVYVERKGRIERAPEGLFEGEEAVLHLIERIVGPLGIRVDESSPWADARLPDGSRVQTRFPRTPFS